ncbi:MAG TPA: hypothetical protein VID48_12115 [Solirubrobacteraceae bacterium]|jgi:hypothetical protein
MSGSLGTGVTALVLPATDAAGHCAGFCAKVASVQTYWMAMKCTGALGQFDSDAVDPGPGGRLADP